MACSLGISGGVMLLQSLGSIPWQAYFQRVLSVHSSSQAVVLSVVGAFGAVLFAVPSVIIGAVATSASECVCLFVVCVRVCVCVCVRELVCLVCVWYVCVFISAGVFVYSLMLVY